MTIVEVSIDLLSTTRYVSVSLRMIEYLAKIMKLDCRERVKDFQGGADGG
jgi:hypothetical protein